MSVFTFVSKLAKMIRSFDLTMFSKSGKPEDVQKRVDSLLNLVKKYSTTLDTVELTHHSDDHKLHGIDSVNTSVLLNPICASRRNSGCDCICSHCYAAALGKAYINSLTKKLARNTGRLTSHLLSEDEMPIFGTRLGRIESFGDVMNVVQARNYIRIIRFNPHTQFGIWSKNLGIWDAAFGIEGKPENCTFVASSPIIDKPMQINEAQYDFVDHRFTVYTDTPEHRAESNCAGIRCMSCLKCYRKGGCFDIKEILR